MTRMTLMLVILALGFLGAPKLNAAQREAALDRGDSRAAVAVLFDDEDEDVGDEDDVEEENEDEDEGPFEWFKDLLEDLLGFDLEDLFGGDEDGGAEDEGEDEGAEADTGSF